MQKADIADIRVRAPRAAVYGRVHRYFSRRCVKWMSSDARVGYSQIIHVAITMPMMMLMMLMLRRLYA